MVLDVCVGDYNLFAVHWFWPVIAHGLISMV